MRTWTALFSQTCLSPEPALFSQTYISPEPALFSQIYLSPAPALSLERDGLRQPELCPRNTMMMNINNTLISDRSKPGITKTAPTVRHRDTGDKYATGVPKIKKI